MQPGIPLLIAMFVGLAGVYALVLVGKRAGDEMAIWVSGQEDAGEEFSVDWVYDDSRHPSLGRYRPYRARYLELRRARGESVTPAVVFRAVEVGIAVLVVAILGGMAYVGVTFGLK